MSSISNNYNININVNNNSSTQAAVPQSSVSEPIFNNEQAELLKKFNVDSDTYKKIIAENPDFKNLDPVKQWEIVERYKAMPKAHADDVEETQEPASTSNEFDRKNYNSLTDAKQKIDTTFFEAAKNIYIYGSTSLKDKQGNLLLQPHSIEEWNNLSEEAKMAEVNKLKQYIETHDELGLKEKFSTIPEDKKANIVDGTMTMIQAANSSNESFVDLMLKKTENERLDIKNSYLSKLNEDELSSVDKITVKYHDFLGKEIEKVINDRNKAAGREDFQGKIESSGDISEYLELYNLDGNELVYNALKNKSDRTDVEEKIFNGLNEIYGTEAGQNLIKRDKISNLRKLDREFKALENKAKTEELVGDDLQRFNVLKETLNTDESKELMHLREHLPKAETDFEKSVLEDSKILSKQNRESQGIAHLNSIKFIEDKTKGMSTQERKNYIEAFMKFGRSNEKVALLLHYKKEFPEILDDINNIDTAAVCTAHLDNEESKRVTGARIAASMSDNPLLHESAIAAQHTANSIYQTDACRGSEFDAQKLNNSKCASSMEYKTSTEATVCLNGATDVNTTITDAKVQLEAQEQITNSKSANDDVHIYTVSKAKDFHKDNQVPVLDTATARSKKATAYAAENNIIAQLDSSNQKDAYSLVQSRINEQYKGADIDKYQSALANQIKNCDSRVQSELVDMVYQSGNQKAIETAVSNMTSYKNEVVIKQEYPRIFGETVLANAKTEEFQEKFLNGKLSLHEVSQLSTVERRKYFTELFKKASPEQKIQWLSKMSDGTQKKTIYTLIALYDSNLLGRMVESGLGLQMFNICNDVKAQNKIFAVMDRSENESVKKQCALIKNDPRNAGLFIGENMDEKEPKTARTLYSSVPFNSNGYEFFKHQDKRGTYLRA